MWEFLTDQPSYNITFLSIEPKYSLLVKCIYLYLQFYKNWSNGINDTYMLKRDSLVALSYKTYGILFCSLFFGLIDE